MSILYSISIFVYVFFIRVASLFNKKAGLWVRGRKNLFDKIEKDLENGASDGRKKIAWFHCASLGEFEQGRPVIEKFRRSFPEYRILLTFYSPSGYEVRKNSKEADFIYYLPSDTKKNAERFISLFNPELVFFIKYEYWFNYLEVLTRKNIPVYIISAIFRPGQYFFKSYGSWFRKKLRSVSWFFVQDDESKMLLESIGIKKVSVSGDTRFDRVLTVTGQRPSFPLIDTFSLSSTIILAGSTWPDDEDVLLPLMNENRPGLKFIIAPHEVHRERITALMARIMIPAIRYSEAAESNIHDARIIIIDSIGILAHLYQYAYIAFIGGGFGAGIHNILEAAAYGIPVIFGPNYGKFREARDLSKTGGACSINQPRELIEIVDRFLKDPLRYKEASSTCKRYVMDNRGASDRIMEKITIELLK